MDEKKPRALRRLDSFSRRQAVFPGALEIADELRAMTLIARTLNKLDEGARTRAVRWLEARYLFEPAVETNHAHDPQDHKTEEEYVRCTQCNPLEEHLSKEESLRIARAKVLGLEEGELPAGVVSASGRPDPSPRTPPTS